MNYKLKNFGIGISVIELLREVKLDYDVVNGHFLLSETDYIKPIGEASWGDLTFYKGNNINFVNMSRASAIMLHSSLKEKVSKNKCYIFVDNVRLEFAKLLIALTESYHSLVINYPVYDGHIGSNVIIEDGAKLGSNINIMGNNYIYGNVEIGDNVTIQPGAVIGGDGFGHVLDGGKYLTFPHLGKVIIEDDVVVGSNTCIDRGTLGATIIKKGCQIDNLVHIAHNDIINENCLITAGTVVGGSVTIGNNSRIGIGTNILQGTKIGSRVVSGMGACINKDTNDNMLTYGVPAKEKKEVTKSLLED